MKSLEFSSNEKIEKKIKYGNETTKNFKPCNIKFVILRNYKNNSLKVSKKRLTYLILEFFL